MNYATSSDVIKYRQGLEATTIEHLVDDIIPTCSAALRIYAKQVNIDLDSLVQSDADIQLLTAKAVVDASVNYMNASESNEPLMSQFTQSVGGYSVSGSYANIGQGFYFPKQVLRTLGIMRQKVGVVEVFDYDKFHC
ncbi:MAG: Gp19/Gp15/Gp42 family protein [Prevotellaceae bacterium]|nr:Gp19/Gp15/Gp42 family protein [Prevotellaceae bacterium]